MGLAIPQSASQKTALCVTSTLTVNVAEIKENRIFSTSALEHNFQVSPTRICTRICLYCVYKILNMHKLKYTVDKMVIFSFRAVFALANKNSYRDVHEETWSRRIKPHDYRSSFW